MISGVSVAIRRGVLLRYVGAPVQARRARDTPHGPADAACATMISPSHSLLRAERTACCNYFGQHAPQVARSTWSCNGFCVSPSRATEGAAGLGPVTRQRCDEQLQELCNLARARAVVGIRLQTYPNRIHKRVGQLVRSCVWLYLELAHGRSAGERRGLFALSRRRALQPRAGIESTSAADSRVRTSARSPWRPHSFRPLGLRGRPYSPPPDEACRPAHSMIANGLQCPNT